MARWMDCRGRFEESRSGSLEDNDVGKECLKFLMQGQDQSRILVPIIIIVTKNILISIISFEAIFKLLIDNYLE